MIKNALLISIFCVVLFLVFLPAYVKMHRMRGTNQEYKKNIVALKEENLHLEEERRRLLEDPEYFEKVARQKLGIVKEGEVIYKIVPVK